MKLGTTGRTLGIGNSHPQGVNEEALLRGSYQLPRVQVEEEWKSLQPVHLTKEQEELLQKNLIRKELAEREGTPAHLETEQQKATVQEAEGAGSIH